jgi:hypothetical protein
MHLLIAAHTGQSYALWKSTSHVLRDVTEPDMIGFTDYMYRHTMKEYQPNNLPPTQLILLSLRILDFARQTSTCVDKPYSVVIVRNNGIHVFDGEITKQLVTNIEMFGAQINRLLLACGDTSIRSEVFTKQFEEFITTVQRLRRENMQEIGKREVSRMFEPGYSGDPISLTPLGTKFTMYDDAKSVIVSVEEESLEDIAWRREMMRQTEDKIEEMRLAKEKLTKLAEGYGEPLYEGNEQILLRPARPLA